MEWIKDTNVNSLYLRCNSSFYPDFPGITEIHYLVLVIDNLVSSKINKLNRLTIDYYVYRGNIFPTSTFNISTEKYGTDFNKKCIIGFYTIFHLNRYTPYFKFDLTK